MSRLETTWAVSLGFKSQVGYRFDDNYPRTGIAPKLQCSRLQYVNTLSVYLFEGKFLHNLPYPQKYKRLKRQSTLPIWRNCQCSTVLNSCNSQMGNNRR